MRRSIATGYLLFLILVFFIPGLNAQDLFPDAEGERIQVCTDRTMYISGEKVLFTAIIYNVKGKIDEDLSHIFYCELITPDGKKIASGKYLLQEGDGQGCIAIPDETVTGIYFLKFYTRLMRNAGTADYKYIMLKIINPRKTEVLPGNDAPDTIGLAWNKTDLPANDSLISIIPVKKVFSSREEIRINVNAQNGIPGRICLSVVPEYTFKDRFIPDKTIPDTIPDVSYFPETRGISLSGKVINKESGKSVAGARIYLSIIGDRDILVFRTDSSGRFYYALPDYIGNRDIFLCSGSVAGITSEILIDNDFCPRPVPLPSPVFTLDDQEKKAAFKLAVNSRLTSLFNNDTLSHDITEEKDSASFYGIPSEVLIMDKYIELPTLDEYFTQLPGMVKLRKVRGKKEFRFYTDDPGMAANSPLLLVDWVAVDDAESILAMSPRNLERIELVNYPYIKGDLTFGGIISFVSKKNDFGGINLSKSGTFINYSFLEKCASNIPAAPVTATLPDSRNTVYWDPAVKTDSNGQATLSFLAPDTPGKYFILLREMTDSGKISTTSETIIVK
jgi:hypothetical protein